MLSLIKVHMTSRCRFKLFLLTLFTVSLKQSCKNLMATICITEENEMNICSLMCHWIPFPSCFPSHVNLCHTAWKEKQAHNEDVFCLHINRNVQFILAPAQTLDWAEWPLFPTQTHATIQSAPRHTVHRCKLWNYIFHHLCKHHQNFHFWWCLRLCHD